MDIRSLQREEQECLRQAEAYRSDADRHHAAASHSETTDDMEGASAHSKEALLSEGKAKDYLAKAARIKQQIEQMKYKADYLEHEINDLKSRRSAITGE